jgi:hypothetical protein
LAPCAEYLCALAFGVSGRKQSALRVCGPISKLPPLASEEVEAGATQTASRPHPRLLRPTPAPQQCRVPHQDGKSSRLQESFDANRHRSRHSTEPAAQVSIVLPRSTFGELDRANRPVGGRDVPRSHWGHQTGRPLLTFNMKPCQARRRRSGSAVLYVTTGNDRSACWFHRDGVDETRTVTRLLPAPFRLN